MDKNLTAKQSKVLAVLEKYISSNNGVSPTFEELRSWLVRDGLKLKSNNSLVQYLNVLEKEGMIEKFSKKRGIRLLTENLKDFVEVPLLGRANCGEALAMAENYIEDYINISQKYIRGKREDYFFIKADGDSMDRENIRHGDLVLVKRTDGGEVKNGDIIVATINGLATIKKFYRKSGNPILVPSSNNLKHKPIFMHPEDSIFICGKVEKVFNSMSF